MNVADIIPEINYVVDDESLTAFLSGKTILITGAAGSIGSALVFKLLTYKPGKLVLIDTAETPLHHVGLQLNEFDIPYISYLADIRDVNRLQCVFKEEQPEIVIHTAAYKHVGLTENNPWEAIEVNTLGTQNLCEVSMEYGVQNFVFISTDKAVNPISVLGVTKLLAEVYVKDCDSKQSETNFNIVRFGNVFNSNGSVIETFTEQLLSGKPVTITDRRAERYFISIANVSCLVLQTLLLSKEGNLFTFEMGEPIKIEALLDKLSGYFNTEPVEVKETGLRAGEKLSEELYEATAEVTLTSHPKIIAIKEPEVAYNVATIFSNLKTFITCPHSSTEIKNMLQSIMSTKN